MAITCGVKTLAILPAAALSAGPVCAAPSPGEDAAAPAPYCLAFLRPAPARLPVSAEEGRRIMGAHMADIQGMADGVILLAAGPMDDSPTTISGIFVLKAASLGEARRVAWMDPTVTGRRNTVDVYPWWGPHGIGEA